MSLCGFYFTSLFIFSPHFLQTCVGGELDQETPPTLELVQVFSGVSLGVMLRCRVPPGHGGRVFELYHLRKLTLSKNFITKHTHADFLLNINPTDTEDIYCCRYDHSMYSPYTQVRPPSRPTTPPAPPQLLVMPPYGHFQSGQEVEFHCQAPPNLAPVAFVLQKQHGEDDNQVLSRSSNPQFRKGPVGVADGGMYTCFYQLNLLQGVQNSAPSAPVSVTVVDLPVPRLSQGEEGALVCTGSPSYPGASFSLFQQGSSLPIATQHANTIHHSMQFPPSGLHGVGGGYQCQYSVVLGETWAHSELSTPILLSCVTGSLSCSPPSTDNYSPHTGLMDLPLVCGSVAAALLFLMVLIFMVCVIRKYAKTAAKKRRQREQEQFWQQVHSRDHIIDLTLQRVRTGSKDDCSVAEPIYDCPFSTFTCPPDY